MPDDDWGSEDPFSDPADPRAAEREQRRLEREERRQAREDKQAAKAKAEPPPPPPPPDPPLPPRTPEEDFWEEEPEEPEPVAPQTPEPARGPRPPRPGSGALGALRRHPFRVVAAIVAIAVAWFLIALFQPLHGDGSGRVVVTIPKGASVSEVGDILDEKGVVSSSTLFQIRVTIAGKRSDLPAGHFVLANDMSYGSAIDELSKSKDKPQPAPAGNTITIPEGYSRAQTAPLAREVGLKGSYLKETVSSKYLDPAEYGGKDAKDLEGFLFPDTFDFKPHAPVANLVQLQLQDFKRRIEGVDMGYARSKNLTVYDVVTIASMVQAESGTASQDKLVAAVIYNRLHEGMPLGIDATIRFATGNYESPLTESELATDSPYNTRLNQGLPPGPIGNPGLAAIEAAAHPAKADYLFYVTKPNACNELEFSKTEAEFEADAARYNAAREAAGGNSPTTC